jgi:hypothetical protein
MIAQPTTCEQAEDMNMNTTTIHPRVPIAAALVALTVGAAPAQSASAPPSAVCTNTFTATITPGFTPRPGAGKLSSNGQTGSIECFGRIQGQRVTGPGTLGFVERHRSGSCRGHTGTGRVHLVIPTAAGSKDMVGSLAVRRTALMVRVTVRFPGVFYSGNGVVFPRLGDCTSTPLEQIKVTMTGSLRDSGRR